MSRALITDGCGRTELKQVEVPTPARGELILRLAACGLCGTDLYKVARLRRRPASRQDPIVLGHELVGVVESVGNKAGFSVGERLAVAHHVPCGQCALCERGAETNCPEYRENLLQPGGFSERVLIRERAVLNSAFPVMDTISDDTALFLEPTACVLRGLAKAQLVEWSGALAPRVAVLGCGSMGLLHLLVLRAIHQESTIVMIDPLERRRRLARSLGADVVSGDHEQLDTGQAVDVAFDTVGSADALTAALELVRPGGTVVLFAHGREEQRSAFSANDFFRAEQRIVATYSSGRIDQIRAHELIHRGPSVFDPSSLVSHRLPLSEFDRAIALAADRHAEKIVFIGDAQQPARAAAR